MDTKVARGAPEWLDALLLPGVTLRVVDNRTFSVFDADAC